MGARNHHVHFSNHYSSCRGHADICISQICYRQQRCVTAIHSCPNYSWAGGNFDRLKQTTVGRKLPRGRSVASFQQRRSIIFSAISRYSI